MNIDKAKKEEIFKRMMANAIPLSERQSRSKMCIYGDNGVGKTTYVAALARKLIGPDKTIIFVDTNEGYESLRNHKELIHEKIIPLPFESVEQLYVIAESIYRKNPGFEDVGAVIFDDADFMADTDLKYLWQDRVQNNPGSKLDPDKPERPEYLKLGFRFTGVLQYIYEKTPNVHLFMTAHTKEKKTQDGQTVLKVFPGFNPALASEIAGKLHVVGYMTGRIVKSGEKDSATYQRTIQVHPTSMIDAKTRIGCDKIKYEAIEFMKHVDSWVKEGRPEDNEVQAVLSEIQTSKMVTSDDELVSSSEDDAPVVVE